MKTAKEILHSKASQNNDSFMSGQPKWILEAMQEYAREVICECAEKVVLSATHLEIKESIFALIKKTK